MTSPALPPSQNPWFLPPSFDHPPDARIALGNILADPLAPHRPLARLPPATCPPVTTTLQHDVSVSHTDTRGVSASAGAQLSLLQSGGGTIEGARTRHTASRFAAAALRTETFASDPEVDEVAALVRETPRAARVLLRSGFRFGTITAWGGRGRELYIVVGVKIARGLRVAEGVVVERKAGVGADVPVSAIAAGVPGLGVSAGVSGFCGKGNGMELSVEGEVVLAYQLLKVVLKGWRRDAMELEEYYGRSGLRMLGERGEASEGSEKEAVLELMNATAVEVYSTEDETGTKREGGVILEVVPLESKDSVAV